MQTYLRHWRQRFDPNAEFVYTKRMTLSVPKTKKDGKPVTRHDGSVVVEVKTVHRGDSVDKRLWGGAHRLRLLWDSKHIMLRDWIDPAAVVSPSEEEVVV